MFQDNCMRKPGRHLEMKGTATRRAARGETAVVVVKQKVFLKKSGQNSIQMKGREKRNGYQTSWKTQEVIKRLKKQESVKQRLCKITSCAISCLQK